VIINRRHYRDYRKIKSHKIPDSPTYSNPEVLEKLEIDCLNKLLDRISSQRPKDWKELTQRILKLAGTNNE
jgi:hypothetical protein